MAASLERNAAVMLKRLFAKSSCRLAIRTRSNVASRRGAKRPEGDINQQFIYHPLRQLLKKLTGFNLDKIYEPKLADVKPPKYRLVTDEELKEIQEKAESFGRGLIHMVPVLTAADLDARNIISEEPAVANFDIDNEDVNYIFTDISYGIPDHERSIVVRDQRGTLRDAAYQERKRILQIYFPKPGRMYKIPQMFSEKLLEERLTEGKYQYILDRACVQFDPDDPEYVRVSQRTYQHIAETGQFDVLHSTKHFGPMVFCLVRDKNADPLVVHYLSKKKVEEAGDVVRVYYMLHTSLNYEVDAENDASVDLLTVYAENESNACAIIKLALQAALEENQGVSVSN